MVGYSESAGCVRSPPLVDIRLTSRPARLASSDELAGVPVSDAATAELAWLVRAAGADELADRLERAIVEEVLLLALTIDERAVILAALEDPPDGLAELRGVLMNEHQWRQRTGLDA